MFTCARVYSPTAGMSSAKTAKPCRWNVSAPRCLPEPMAVEEDRDRAVELADLNRLHARTDLATHGFRGDPERSENLELTFGGCPPVTAHARHAERFAASDRDGADRGPGHLGDPVDPPAADPQADPLAGLNRVDHRLEGRVDRSRDVRDLRGVEVLADKGPARQFLVPEYRERVLGRGVQAGKHGDVLLNVGLVHQSGAAFTVPAASHIVKSPVSGHGWPWSWHPAVICASGPYDRPSLAATALKSSSRSTHPPH